MWAISATPTSSSLAGTNASKPCTKGGICGFPDPSESPYDLFAVGHAGTAISTAVGMARADMLQKRNSKIVALVGDASIVNGLAFEGLNNAGTLKRQMLIILNDNSMSISEPQGAFANYLEHLRVTTTYEEVKKKIHHLLEQIPYGQQISDITYHVKQGIKNTLAPGHIFEDLGLKYFGPVDGHDIPSLIEKLNELKDLNAPAVLHIKTVKGKGYEWACDDPTTFHSPKAYRVEGCRVVLEKGTGRSWTAAFADALVAAAKKNDKIVGITAAMPDGTGTIKLKPVFPDRYFDTGICESHATVMAAGMAKAGLRPVVAIYSTFIQRAFDQIFQEVCLQGLPVTFCLDRAGLVGDDGAVHHGFCDLAFLRSQPGIVLMAPSDERDLARPRHGHHAGFPQRYPLSARQLSARTPGRRCPLDHQPRWRKIPHAQDRHRCHAGRLWLFGVAGEARRGPAGKRRPVDRRRRCPLLQTP